MNKNPLTHTHTHKLGDTKTGKNAKPLDCTPESLATDLSNLLEAIYPNKNGLPEKVVLCGHSMGGTTSIHAAYSQVVPNLAAMIILDVAQSKKKSIYSP